VRDDVRQAAGWSVAAAIRLPETRQAGSLSDIFQGAKCDLQNSPAVSHVNASPPPMANEKSQWKMEIEKDAGVGRTECDCAVAAPDRLDGPPGVDYTERRTVA